MLDAGKNKSIVLSGKDADGDVLSYEVGKPKDGVLSGKAPNLVYTPKAGYHGLDAFSFKVNDGQVSSDVAIVSITVNPVNNVPVAISQSVVLDAGKTKSIVLSGKDADGDGLSYEVGKHREIGRASCRERV